MPMDDHISDAAIVAELGRRLAAHRVARSLTQAEFADRAGVARSTVQRIERGESIQLASFVKILRALGRVDALDAVLAPNVRSPLADLERDRSRRKRVRHGSGGQRPGGDAGTAPWTWGDEEPR